ncbi:MAG: HAD family phosphatase [Oscillospiraceae bacterium]|nr:HAD family phosphatase [Oscillospiraceae bacterium]
MEKRKTAVLFDMDGVIFDSERAQMAVWFALAAEAGLRDMERVYHRCIGVTVEATGAILKEEYGADFPWEDFRRRTNAAYRARYAGGRLPLKEGARELLEALHARGVPLALASSTGGELVRAWLSEAGLLEIFDVLVTGDMVSRSKPDPEIFLRACELLNVKPSEAYVIEDSYNGVRAAHAGGMHALMVPDLLPPDAEMREKAEKIFPTLREAGEYLIERITNNE